VHYSYNISTDTERRAGLSKTGKLFVVISIHHRLVFLPLCEFRTKSCRSILHRHGVRNERIGLLFNNCRTHAEISAVSLVYTIPTNTQFTTYFDYKT